MSLAPRKALVRAIGDDLPTGQPHQGITLASFHVGLLPGRLFTVCVGPDARLHETTVVHCPVRLEFGRTRHGTGGLVAKRRDTEGRRLFTDFPARSDKP